MEGTFSELMAMLDERQHMAVTAPDGRVCVMAGAGTGKTRVLTMRIAWLIWVAGCGGATYGRHHVHQ